MAAASSACSASKTCSACSISVSTSPMPRMRLAIRSGWKTSKSSSFSPVGREQDRHAGDLAHRQRRAAAGVAVQLGQHHTGEADAVAERLGGGDGVLADHRVEHEQHLVGLDGVPDRGGLAHHLLVDAQPAGGVDDDHVEVLGVRLGEPGGRDGDRVTGRRLRLGAAVCPGAGAKTATPARSPTICSWLTAPGRCRSQATSSGVWPWPLQPVRQLAGQRGLTGALQAGQHDHRRRGLGERQLAGLAAEDADQFLVDDLDDLLGRVERGGDLRALGALLDAGRRTSARPAARRRPRAARAGSRGRWRRCRRRTAGPCRAGPPVRRSTGRTGIQTRRPA